MWDETKFILTSRLVQTINGLLERGMSKKEIQQRVMKCLYPNFSKGATMATLITIVMPVEKAVVGQRIWVADERLGCEYAIIREVDSHITTGNPGTGTPNTVVCKCEPCR